METTIAMMEIFALQTVVITLAAVLECWRNAGGPGTNDGDEALASLLVAVKAIDHGWLSIFSPLLTSHLNLNDASVHYKRPAKY